MPVDADSSPAVVSPAVRLIRGLEQRYRFVLASVAVILVVDLAVLQPQLVKLNGLAPSINLAGRQRMLSQRITKAALALERNATPATRDACREELSTAIASWRRVHQGLRAGDSELHLTPSASPTIVSSLADLEPVFTAMEEAAIRVASTTDTPARPDDVATILEFEPDYLTRMDHIVALYEQEAQHQVARLRWMALAAATCVIVLLAGLGRVVLRPAIGLIRGQMEQLISTGNDLRAARDQLEIRVAERTRELTVANEALQSEIHERELAEDRNRSLQQQLTSASRVTSLGQLATGLAHEINQPLAVIANYAETADLAMTKGEYGPGTQECVRRIREAALRAGQIVRRMRNFLRPAASTRGTVSMRELIDDILQLCTFELQRAQVRVELDWDDATPDIVSADVIQIQQVLVNLVQNSLQAMQSTPEAERVLTLRFSRADDELQIDVEDTGAGFDAACSDITDSPFMTTKPEGLGLGLAISRSIIAAHLGRLWAANREQGGASVSFTLPVVNVHVDGIATTADSLCRG